MLCKLPNPRKLPGAKLEASVFHSRVHSLVPTYVSIYLHVYAHSQRPRTPLFRVTSVFRKSRNSPRKGSERGIQCHGYCLLITAEIGLMNHPSFIVRRVNNAIWLTRLKSRLTDERAMLGNSDKIASRRIQLRGSRLRQRRCTRNFPGSDPETSASAYARSPSGVEIRPKDPSSRQLGITVRDIRPLALLLHIPTESIRMFYFRGRCRHGTTWWSGSALGKDGRVKLAH